MPAKGNAARMCLNDPERTAQRCARASPQSRRPAMCRLGLNLVKFDQGLAGPSIGTADLHGKRTWWEREHESGVLAACDQGKRAHGAECRRKGGRPGVVFVDLARARMDLEFRIREGGGDAEGGERGADRANEHSFRRGA